MEFKLGLLVERSTQCFSCGYTSAGNLYDTSKGDLMEIHSHYALIGLKFDYPNHQKKKTLDLCLHLFPF